MSATRMPHLVKATWNRSPQAACRASHWERRARRAQCPRPRAERERQVDRRVQKLAPGEPVAGQGPRDDEAEKEVDHGGGERDPERGPQRRKHAGLNCDFPDAARAERQRARDKRAQRKEHDQGQIDERDSGSEPEPGQRPAPQPRNEEGHGQWLAFGSGRTRRRPRNGSPGFFPPAEDLVDRDQLKLRQSVQVSLRGEFGLGRTEEVLRDDRLRGGSVRELKTALRDLAGALASTLPSTIETAPQPK